MILILKACLNGTNSALMEHGNGMLKIALNEIPETIPIGFKIPGIHWRIKDPKMPRISEMTCGAN
ncbi:MAG: hypothetical protein CM15mP4_1110 [Candidatus Neomarinimicrobiota bacterium]|nr:MAG: hypothetical protein CM15mP4_1110 [Candidatus Neomarinimicrobiota bacterium]